MDPNEFLRNAFIGIAVPCLGLGVLFALLSGKVKTAGLCLLALVLAGGLMFMPAGTIENIGSASATGLYEFFTR